MKVSRPCCAKEINKGSWSREEDETLFNYVTIHGEGRWQRVAQNAGLKRCGKSCRQRWLNYLKPGIKRGDISVDEEDMIIRLHRLLGNRWALIAKRLPGRTDNEIKNYWNTNLSKKLQRQPTPAWPPSPSCNHMHNHLHKLEEEKTRTKQINVVLEAPRPTRVKAVRYGKIIETNGSDSRSIPSLSDPVEGDQGDVNASPSNFLMDNDQNQVLIPEDFNSKLPENGEVLDQNKVGLNNSYSLSSSASQVLLPETVDPLETLLDMELKRIAYFLGMEDECRDLP